MNSEALNARSGARVSPSTVAGVSQPEKFHMTTASPTPRSAPSVRPSARNGVHGTTRAVAKPATIRPTTGKSAAAASTTAARPTGRTPSTLRAVSTTTKAAAGGERPAPACRHRRRPEARVFDEERRIDGHVHERVEPRPPADLKGPERAEGPRGPRHVATLVGQRRSELGHRQRDGKTPQERRDHEQEQREAGTERGDHVLDAVWTAAD